MPVPKGYENIYGKIVGHLQNIGYGLEAAKTKTDHAITKLKNKAKKKKGNDGRGK